MIIKRIAVLMTCYNRVVVTRKCLLALQKQEIPNTYVIDVYLVDDASPDNTGEIIKKEFPYVNVIRGFGDLYWCGGTRLAWEIARVEYDYDFYLWLNDDVRLSDGAITSLLLDYETVSAAKMEGLVAGTFYEGIQEPRISYGCTSENRKGRLVPDGEPQIFSGTMSGNLVLVPRYVFNTIGSLSKEFTHGMGDYDYAYRARKAGCHTWCGSVIHGVCKGNPGFDMKLLRSMSLKARIAVLYSPKAFALREYCIYKKRHWGWRWIGAWAKAWLKILLPKVFIR
jgi:GT2 family glycosyltransferase